MRFPFPRLSAAAASLALALLSCSNGTTTRDTVTVPANADFSTANVYAVDFSGADQVNLTAAGLNGKTLILAKINKGSSAASATATGSAALTSVVAASTRASSRAADLSATTSSTTRPPRRPHPLAGSYNATTSTTRSASTRVAAASARSAAAYAAGDSQKFWVDYYDANWVLQGFDTMTATLAKVTTHAYIWVADSGDTDNAERTGGFDPSTGTNFTDKVQLLADAFDSVVWPEDTAIFGFERGGDPNQTTDIGGVDGDQHVSIFVYDIDLDNNASTSGYVAGYFWSKDDDTADPTDVVTDVYETSGYYPSNGKEMFYLDAKALDDNPYTIVSTLAHEYQHMINYNKVTYEGRYAASTWLDEFRSLAAEDLLAPAFEEFSAANTYSNVSGYDYFSDGPGYWTSYFNTNYQSAAGLSKWGGTTYDYAFASMLASYLHRAYGGVAFMDDHIALSDSGTVGIDASLLNAIDSAFARSAATDGTAPATGAASDLTSFFSGILEPFVYALWGLGADGTAGTSPFIRADAKAAASLSLDAFTTRNSNTTIIQFPLPNPIPSSYKTTTINPGCYDIASPLAIPAYSFTFHTNASLQDIDSATLTLTAPNDADVEYRLIAIE